MPVVSVPAVLVSVTIVSIAALGASVGDGACRYVGDKDGTMLSDIVIGPLTGRNETCCKHSARLSQCNEDS